MSKEIISIDAPVGLETEDVSTAKDEAADLIREWAGETFVTPEDFDAIHIADTLMSRLIELGWRPTKEEPS